MNIQLNYNPYDKQLQFHQLDTRFKGFIGGLGSGKTLAGSVEAIRTILNYPDSLGVILAPTYPLLRDSTMRTFVDLLPQELILEFNRSEHKIKFINGAEILFRSGDDDRAVDRLRNINIDWFWMDEAALFSSYAWKVLIGRLRGQHGPRKAWITTTPKGFNWIYEKFVQSPSKDYSYVTSSSMENTYLPPDYIESLKSEYVGVFAQQEIMGAFVGFEGVVYPEFNRGIHVIRTEDIEFKQIVAGVDFGFTNPSVILKIGIDNDGRMHVIKEFYQRHITDSQLADWAKSNLQDVEYFIADSENPSGIKEFQNRGLRCRGVDKKPGERRENFVTAGIKMVSNMLRTQNDGKPRIYVDSSCVNTIMEFENYRYADKKDNQPTQENPIKLFDHSMDALRYVIWSLDSAAFSTLKIYGVKRHL